MILRLIEILILLETDSGIHDNGNAIGPLQIKPIYVRDVNRIAKGGLFFKHEDARELDKAVSMVHIYLRYYEGKFYQRHGYKPSVYQLAMMHRLGPFGYSHEDHDYGNRARNLYESRAKRALNKS